jgi:hypothetical protein
MQYRMLFYMGNYFLPDGTPVRCFFVICLTQSTRVQCIICGSICAWRTVVIWNKDKCVIAILVFFILVSTGT